MRTRFILVMLALPLITIAFFAFSALPDSKSSSSLSQEQTTDPVYDIQPKTEPIEPLSLTQTPVNLSEASIGPGLIETDIHGTIAGITKGYQQMQNVIDACVQKKNQLFNQLVSQTKQLKQLETQMDTLDDQISKANEKQTDPLEKRREQLQRSIDRQSGIASKTQDKLDTHVSRCQSKVSNIQTDIDDLKSELDTQFTDLMEYELPN